MRFVGRFPVQVNFEQQGEKLLLKVVNHSTKDLTECWLLVPGQRFALGHIPRGSSQTKLFSLPGVNANERIGGRSDAVDFREVSFKDKTRDILFHSSYFPRDGEATRWGGRAMVFFGWVKEPDPRVSVDDPRIRNHDYTLFRIISPLAGSEEE
jgi:hypothetical protein